MIKTGDGGFSINGQTYTFDVDDVDAPGIDPTVTDKGDIKINNEKKDISKKTKTTLGAYINAKTIVNKFPVDAGYVETAITTDKGVPARISDATNSKRYVDRDALESNQRGSLLNDKLEDPKQQLDINKGKSDKQRDDGHNTLKDIVGGETPKPTKGIENYLSQVLRNNRFSSLNTMSPTKEQTTPSNYNPMLTHPKLGQMSVNRLAQVGVALSIRSSNEPGSTDQANNPSSGAQEARSLLPSVSQLGASRINTTVLEAKDVLASLTNDEIPDASFVSAAPGGSWGSLNNVHDTYSGMTSIGMIALAVALTSAVVVTFEGLGTLLSLVKGGNESGASKTVDGRYTIGRYRVQQGANPNAFPPEAFPPDIAASLGIRPTVYPFSEALQVGVTTFFGIDTTNGVIGQITSGLQSTLQAPGYNAVVARAIIRSSLTVLDAVRRATESANIVSGVENTLDVLQTLRGSKIISAFNVFASLGDQVLVNDGMGDVIDGLPGEPKRTSKIDALENSVQSVQKNRLKGSLKLAWSNNRTPSSYLIPEPTLALATTGKLGAPNMLNGQSPLAKTYYKVLNLSSQIKSSLRIPYESSDPNDITVKSIEGQLDAEYVPFYLHDLRTNEIISFPAFLTQLSDDFTPNWEQTEALGRVDPVKIYRSTSRRVSIGFMIVATSDEDFVSMWEKVNKLVTMVYPQYTQGRTLTDPNNENRFVQPFSQLMSASPIVRMRLGELFSSNYSRFALSRLFGADTNQLKINSNDVTFSGAVDLFKKLQDDIGSPVGKTYMMHVNNMSKPGETGVTITLPTPSIPGFSPSSITPGTSRTAPQFNINAGDSAYFVFKVVASLDDSRVIVKPELMTAKIMQDFYGLTPKQASQTLFGLESEYDNASKPSKRVIGGQYVANKSDLRISPDRLSTILGETTNSSTNIENLASFLSPDSNAIVRSFKETQGKGLAGTIDSLNFDFYNNVTWETTPGRRAPQFFRVSMTFTPIHDISPGIDAAGYNRAPVYPVGNHMHGVDKF